MVARLCSDEIHNGPVVLIAYRTLGMFLSFSNELLKENIHMLEEKIAYPVEKFQINVSFPSLCLVGYYIKKFFSYQKARECFKT